MTVRPIDLQTMLPRVPEVSRTQQIQNQHEQNQAQQFSSEMHKQTKHAQQQVQHTKETAGNKIKQEKQHSSSSKDEDEKKEHHQHTDKQADPEDSLKDPCLGSHLDIKA